jgi:RNA polymerase sigma factor (sigma-70 family)
LLSYQYRRPMPPPPAEPLAPRIFLGPALRTQSDRRLVNLVREGYEGAFEEIVRRYRRPLDRFAAAIVGNRSEDVTQDAFSKALLALRGTEAEIELRPWLYRIVRNTALNELRDAPPTAEELGDAVAGGESAAAEAERREEIGQLVERLRALPEPQRAAIVMRELEGLSHEEIAAALGVSGGAARQAIHRARVRLRDTLGLLIPLPLVRMLFDHGAEAAAAGAGGAAAVGGLGAGGALKAGVATVLVAGSVGAGVAVQQDREDTGTKPAAATATQASGGRESSGGPEPSESNSGPGSSSSGPGPGATAESDDDSGHGGSGPGALDEDRSRSGSSDSGPGSDSSGSGNEGSGSSGDDLESSGSGSSGGDLDSSGSGSSGEGSDSSGSGSGADD